MSAAAIAAIVIGYVLLSRPAVRTAAPAPAPQPAQARVSPGGTAISIPGFGSYLNVPGQGVAVTLDPRLFGGLLQTPAPIEEPDYYATAQPVMSGPAPSYGYVPEADVPPPITLLPPVHTYDQGLIA